jgi:hypothetical protein
LREDDEYHKRVLRERFEGVHEWRYWSNGNVNLITDLSKKINEIKINDIVQTLNWFNKVVMIIKGIKRVICIVNNMVFTNKN